MTDAPDRCPTVVIVEDEALVAMMVADTLADAGFRTVWPPCDDNACATCGAGAVPDAAVVDLRLAYGLDGRDVVRRLRELCSGTPTVVITDLDRSRPRRASENVAAGPHGMKPCDAVGELVDA